MHSNKNKKKILIVSMRKKAALFLQDTLNDVLSDDIDIFTYSFSIDNENVLFNHLSLTPDLIIASGEYSYSNILKLVNQKKVLIASREVSEPEYFDKLFLIPKGKKVLVVNETEKGTLETIKSLELLGITHLKYAPYWLDCDLDYKDIDIAISPGMLDICPKDIPNKIDIGMRQLSIAFFIRMLKYLSLDLNYLEKYIYKQKHLLITTYKKLSNEFLRAEKLKNSLQTIINGLDEAIIGINKQNKITEFNSASEKLLGFKKEDILNKDFHEVLGDMKNINNELLNNNNIITINKKQIYVTYLPTVVNNIAGGIYTLKEVKELQKKEEHVRRILYKKDFAYKAKHNFNDIIAKNKIMIDLIKSTKHLSYSDSTILITGESGTGKEFFAQSIHNKSSRKNHPFIAVNFAAINDNLIESELFGYEEGAFTGAKKSGKKGLFELAHNGTIFLDEIGDSSLWVQSRLLRVLEEKEIMRLGDTKVIPVNVRVIVATNKNLLNLIEKGSFREDLYYRLNVFKVHIPPLRERREDIRILINSFMEKYNINKTFSEEAYDLISEYNWPGNIRELKNMVEYIAVKARNELIEITDLPYDIRNSTIKNNIDNNENNAVIIDKLVSTFGARIIKHILHITKQNKTSSIKIGRNGMKVFLKNQDIEISDSKIRTLMKYLKEYNLISIGKTKQGTIITKKGEKILNIITYL